MESRVGTLELTIRGERPVIDSVRPHAEAFAIRVLERCDEILERRHPGRVFALKHLDLHLRLSERDFDDAEIDASAADIADRVARAARPPGDARLEEDVVMFADAADWYASVVETHACGTPDRWARAAPFDDEREPAIQALVRDRPLLREVLLRLHQRGTLLPVLDALSDESVEAIARLLGPWEDSAPHESRAAGQALPPAVVRSMSTLPPIASAARAWIVIVIAAYDDLGSRADAEVHDTARRAMAALDARRLRGPTVAAPHSRRDPDIPDAPIETLSAPATEGSIASAFGGVFYLLRVAVEASLAESLWRACLPEGIVLSNAMAFLLEAAAGGNDPAPFLFGGVAALEPPPPIAEEQQVEISEAVFDALVAALVRRQLIATIEPVLRLADTAHGRLLVASAGQSPYVIFARRADSRDDIAAALDAFVSTWPL